MKVERLLDHFDISDAISKGTAAVKHLTGLPAAFIAAVLLFVNYQLIPLIWQFDLGPTDAFGTNVTARINDVAATTFDPVTGGKIILGGILIPTLLEMTAPLFAKNGNGVAAWMWWTVVAFDAYTDNPAVTKVLDAHSQEFAAMGAVGGWITYQIVRFVGLFMASMVLEFYFAVTTVIAVVLIWQAVPRKRKSELETRIESMKTQKVKRLR